MRSLILVVVASCVPSAITERASTRLGAHGKHLHLSYDQIGDRDVYVFCRDEHRRDIGFIPLAGRSYDGACVTYVCPIGDDGRRCEE